ncbi:MAG: hypothetical protein HW414_1356 [Dehalococcoidia bacterium]|nr:hypothetical protein [Dehalococcoidia bacterium]
MEIRPGIHRLELPLEGGPPGGVNCYLIRGTDGYLLLDTGWNTPDTFDALSRQVEESGASLKQIRQIVVTHIHPDHFGLAGRLRELSGARIVVHKNDAACIRSRYVEIDGLLDKIARMLKENGVPEDEVPGLRTASLAFVKLVLPAEPDELLSGGEKLSTGVFEFEVLWTPGHSAGQICLYERSQKLLLSGDHVMPLTTAHVGLHPESGPDPLGDYLKSLELLRHLEAELVLPAHEHVFTDLSRRIDEIVAHHRKRDRAIIGVLRGGPRTAFQVAQRIPWMLDSSPDGTGWSSLNSLDRRLAVMEAMAHLEAMRIRGIVRRRTPSGMILYRLASGNGSQTPGNPN